MKLIVALLDKFPKSDTFRSNKISEGNLLLMNGTKCVLEVKIVRWGWLRESTRSSLTRLRGWLVGRRSNNLLIARYPIKVTSVKKGDAINIRKRQKSVP